MDDKIFDDQAASEWMKTIEAPEAKIRENDIYPLIKDWLARTSAKNLLDIGCGQGACSAHLGNNQIQYTGIDPSTRLIARANELYAAPSRKFINGNAYEIPFGTKHFDSAVSIAVWHLLSDPAKAAKELSRVLNDNGKFLIITADPNQSQTWIDRYEEKKFNGPAFIGTNRNADGTRTSDTLYFRSIDEITAHLEAAGLTTTKTETIRSFIAIFGNKN